MRDLVSNIVHKSPYQLVDMATVLHYYTALLNAVECSIHLNGASQRSVVNYFSIFDRCYA